MNSSITRSNLCSIYSCKVTVINSLFESFCDFVTFMNTICVIIFFLLVAAYKIIIYVCSFPKTMTIIMIILKILNYYIPT